MFGGGAERFAERMADRPQHGSLILKNDTHRHYLVKLSSKSLATEALGAAIGALTAGMVGKAATFAGDWLVAQAAAGTNGVSLGPGESHTWHNLSVWPHYNVSCVFLHFDNVPHTIVAEELVISDMSVTGRYDRMYKIGQYESTPLKIYRSSYEPSLGQRLAYMMENNKSEIEDTVAKYYKR